MKRNFKNITKDLIKRKRFIKNEFKKIILKSIIQNKSTKPITRSFATFKLLSFTRKVKISRQKNVCLLRGRNKGVYKLTQLCRHMTVKWGVVGNLQNLKINSW